REASLRRHRQRPVEDLIDHPRVTVEHPASERDRVMIGDHRRLPRGGEIDPHDRQLRADDRTKSGQLLVASTITARERPTVGHGILLGSGWIATRTLARGMLRVVDPDSTPTGTY